MKICIFHTAVPVPNLNLLMQNERMHKTESSHQAHSAYWVGIRSQRTGWWGPTAGDRSSAAPTHRHQSHQSIHQTSEYLQYVIQSTTLSVRYRWGSVADQGQLFVSWIQIQLRNADPGPHSNCPWIRVRIQFVPPDPDPHSICPPNLDPARYL